MKRVGEWHIELNFLLQWYLRTFNNGRRKRERNEFTV